MDGVSAWPLWVWSSPEAAAMSPAWETEQIICSICILYLFHTSSSGYQNIPKQIYRQLAFHFLSHIYSYLFTDLSLLLIVYPLLFTFIICYCLILSTQISLLCLQYNIYRLGPACFVSCTAVNSSVCYLSWVLLWRLSNGTPCVRVPFVIVQPQGVHIFLSVCSAQSQQFL